MSVDDIKKMIRKIGKHYKDGSSKRQGTLYHPIPFDEFKDVPCHKPKLTDECKFIINDIGKVGKVGKVLEVGCANGLYAFRLYNYCDSILAFEGDSKSHRVNVAIQEYKGIDNIDFRNEYFDDKTAKSLGLFDVALMLNVHMWIHKQIGPDRTHDMLKSLSQKVGVLYFETAHKGSGGMYKVKELKNKEDIQKYLQDAGFSDVTHLKASDLHGSKVRHIFRCSGEVNDHIEH